MTIKVFAHVLNKRPRIEPDLFGAFHVYVREPPMGGEANAAIISALAKFFKVTMSHVALMRGARSKIKYFRVG